MKQAEKSSDVSERPLLYYKTDEQIASYRMKSVEEKLKWLEAQMEFFHLAMPERAKLIREKMSRPRKD